jgi:hypothetical protein
METTSLASSSSMRSVRMPSSRAENAAGGSTSAVASVEPW